MALFLEIATDRLHPTHSVQFNSNRVGSGWNEGEFPASSFPLAIEFGRDHHLTELGTFPMTISATAGVTELDPTTSQTETLVGDPTSLSPVPSPRGGSSTMKRWAARLGVAGFGLFLIKGLVWVAFFAAVATGLASR